MLAAAAIVLHRKKTMTFQDWGALGDMIGGAAVVASLIYLAIQIRQNTQQIANSAEAARRAALDNNIESGNRMRELMMLNPDLASLYLRGIRDYHDLKNPEKFRFGLLIRNVLSSFQGAYLRQLSVGGDPLEFEGAARLIDSIIDNPGVRVWLKKNETDWRPEFRDLINKRLAELDKKSDQAQGDGIVAQTD
jgi:hypothetical protein